MKIFKLSFLFFMLVLASCELSQQSNDPPNIVLIMADDLGYETIGANGGKSYETPVLDKMAEEGMRFEHCYSQPLCTPSRVKIMTGISNVRNYVRFGLLPEGEVTFAHVLKEVGYTTCVIGKWQLGDDKERVDRAGFDYHCLWQALRGRMDSTGRDHRYSKPVLQVNGKLGTFADSDYGPGIVSDFGIDFITHANRIEQPFFLYYPMILTHCPFSPTPASEEWMEDTMAVMSYKGNPEYFGDMVFTMDRIVGNIRQKLIDLGIQDNTLLIFTGDNGTDKPIVSRLDNRIVPGAKGKSTDGGTRVPLIIEWAGTIEPGMVNTDLIDFSDFLPTICDAAGVRVPDSLAIDGVSFYPQLAGKEGNPREWVYNWYSRNGDPDKARVFARTHRYKLYQSGEFYEVPEDYQEQNPLSYEELGQEEKEVYDMLKEVIRNH